MMSRKEIHSLIVQLKELPELEPLDRVQERLEEALAYVRGERETEALTAECAAPPAAAPNDAQDAARYRWLRDAHPLTEPVCVVDSKNATKLVRYEFLDAAIDAALKEQK